MKCNCVRKMCAMVCLFILNSRDSSVGHSHVPQEPVCLWLRSMDELEMKQAVCDLTSKFLKETERVIELSSGEPLKQCFLVRVNAENRVDEVLMEGAL